MQKLTFYALLPFLVCAITDVALFYSGHGYRFLFYESLLCLILFQNRFANIILFSAVFLIKVLFVFFSINIFSLWWLTLEPAFIYASVAAFSISVFYFSKKISILYFLAALVAIVFFDKQALRTSLQAVFYTSYHAALSAHLYQLKVKYMKYCVKVYLMDQPF